MRMNWNRTVAILLVLITGIAGGRLLIASGVVGSEDNLLFYMMGLNLIAEQQLAGMADQAIAFFAANNADPHAMLRLEFRKTYLNEFPLPGAVQLAIGRAYLELFEANRNLYPLFLAQTIVFGLSAAVVIAIAVTTTLVAGTKRPWHLWALASTVMAFALVEFLPIDSSSFATILVNDKAIDVLSHLGQLLVKPGPQFSPLGFTPRSQFTLLMIAVFAFRWANRYDLGYLTVLALSFVHLSSSALVLLALLIIDVFARPQILRAPRLLAILAITIGIIMARQTMWQLIGDIWPLLVFAGGGLAIALLAVWKVPAIRGAAARAFGWLAPLRNRLIAGNKIVVDLRLLIVGWTVSFVVLYAIIAVFDPFEVLSKFYFWGRLHGRTAAIFWPTVVFGFMLLGIVNASRSKHRPRVRIVAAVVALVGVVAVSYPAAVSATNGNVLVRVASDFLQADQRLYGAPIRTIRAMGGEERVLYYAMIKSIDLKENYLPLILR